MSYVDGFVIPVQKKNLAAYLKLAKLSAKVYRELGALAYHECQGDDVPVGKVTSFTRAVKLKPGEVVFFSWVVYKSRAQRDKINAKFMKDPRFADLDPKKMPFDGKRMIFGGFKPVISL